MAKQKTCLLLDLDETLCHTFPDLKSYRKLNLGYDKENGHLLHRCYMLDFIDDDLPTGGQHHMWGIRRPNLDTFLKYCFSHWDVVAVYTAATEDYAHRLCDLLFKENRPHYIFHRKDCMKVEIEPGIEDHVKPIKKLLNDYPDFRSHNFSKIVMLDNKASNFVCNPTFGLVIADYEPVSEVEGLHGDDKYLLAAIVTLERRRIVTKTAVESKKKKNPAWWTYLTSMFPYLED